MSKHRVAQVGCGGRGNDHIRGWLANAGRFEIVALCDLDEGKMRRTAGAHAIAPALYTDADRMLAETKPDLFCFCTQPDVRLAMVELAAKHKVKALAFEKPMARSLEEALRMTEVCRKSGIKTAVCHQQKYLTSMQKLKEIVDSGDIGAVVEVHATSTCNMTDLGTHFTDYMMWLNGFARPQWVVGHVHGRRQLDHSHPSPDFFLARAQFENGVRGLIEIGNLAPIYEPGQEVWQVNRLTARGTHGYAWAETTGIWGALTKSSGGEALRGEGPGYTREEPGRGWETQVKRIQDLYARDVADWMDGTLPDHPCNVEHAYRGFELINAACLSALDHARVDLPLRDPARAADVFARMKELLPECPPRA
ncbi:MAG TPA: Gfo/Idh/MocA family oxidoreductase [Sumerlaeia bacterium]|nr:Gfo/Idh/MocA family oxidoreductase [Sumerlaeia bacterium]